MSLDRSTMGLAFGDWTSLYYGFSVWGLGFWGFEVRGEGDCLQLVVESLLTARNQLPERSQERNGLPHIRYAVYVSCVQVRNRALSRKA
jgi:hypothetical protein